MLSVTSEYTLKLLFVKPVIGLPSSSVTQTRQSNEVPPRWPYPDAVTIKRFILPQIS
jgi:hypothetical protein